MKKLLVLFAAVIAPAYIATTAVAQSHGPMHGTQVDPHTPVSVVGVKYCEDYPDMISCTDPKFMKYGINGAEVECCAERQSTRGGKGGRGGDDGRNKYYCAKLTKTDYIDSDGCPKYAYPTNPKLTMPPCDSRAWVQGEGPCCIPSERCHAGNEKGGKGAKANKPAQQIKNEKPQQAVIMMSTGTLPSIPRPSTIPSTRTAPSVK